MTEKKKKALLGFVAFAVVLIAVLVIWRPPAFRSEDASGSIGAVQKHHAPQITPQDVVLGNETTKHEQQIRYADFLDDAAKLHALSAKITANNFDAASAEVAAMRGEVKQRYIAAANEALAAARAGAREANRDADSEISELSAILANGPLNDAQMESFNAKLAALSARDGVKSAAERAAAAKSQVDAALAEMRSNRSSDAAARIDNAANDLKAMNAITLADRANYLKAIEVESKALDRARDGIMGQPMASALSANADALEIRAAKAMDNQLGLLVVICSAVRDIDANIAAARGAQASVAGRSEAYDRALLNASQTFDGTKAAINAQASAGVNFELAALNSYFTAARAGSRAPALDAVLANLSQAVASNTALGASLEQRDALAMRAQEMVNQKNAARTENVVNQKNAARN